LFHGSISGWTRLQELALLWPTGGFGLGEGPSNTGIARKMGAI